MKKIYISGKITDNPNYQFEFECAHRRLQHNHPSDIIINPTEICSPNWSWIRCMFTCIRELVNCDIIVLINGWQTSRGARIERLIANMLHIEIYSIVIYRDGSTTLYPYEI